MSWCVIVKGGLHFFAYYSWIFYYNGKSARTAYAVQWLVTWMIWWKRGFWVSFTEY